MCTACSHPANKPAGAYALVEAVVHPGGGPPMHWHTREDEMFFILEGQVTFAVGEQTIVAETGTFLQAPRNLKHRFQNLSNRRARMLIQTVPAGFEKFMAEFAPPCAINGFTAVAGDPGGNPALV